MKIIYFITCCLMIIKGFGQINTIKVVTDKKIESIQAYDSLKNFLGRDIKKYIGQDLYLYGGIVPSITKEYGYENFYTKILDKYERPAKSNVYKCCAEKSFSNSEYEALKEKYFKVMDVVDGKNYDEYYLKLIEKNSNDIVYFKYNQENKYAFPFLVVGFVEKLKNNVVGKDFVFTKGKVFIDINGKDYDRATIGNILKCTDVSIVEKNDSSNLSLIFNDKAGHTFSYNYEYVYSNFDNDYTIPRFAYSQDEAIEFEKTFGKIYWSSVLNEEIKIGMPYQACYLIWGRPEKINETITAGKKSQQWIYKDKYAYFINNKLQSYNNK